MFKKLPIALTNVIFLLSPDYQFTMYTASTLAAASIAAALQGLEWGTRANVPLSDLLARLHCLTGVEQVNITTNSCAILIFKTCLILVLYYLRSLLNNKHGLH